MSEIDVQALEQIRAMAAGRLARMARARNNEPLMEAMAERMKTLMTEITPQVMAPATANARKSVISLEESVEKLEEQIREAGPLQQALLESVRKRTASLKRLLEAVS